MSSFERARIRDGDSTTAGGRVEARPQRWPVTCHGRQVRLDGDLCLCNRSKPPRLVALHHIGFEALEIAAMQGSTTFSGGISWHKTSS